MAGSSNNTGTGALYFGTVNPTLTGQEVDNDSFIVTSDGTPNGTIISFWKFDEETLTWVIVPSGDLNNDRVLYTGNTAIPTLAPPKGVDTAVLSNGTRYDWDGTVWVVQPGAIFDSTVDFSVNTNPNTAGTTFTPNTPASTTVLYVSSVDGSQWTYNGTSYITAPISSDWKITGNTGTVQATNFLGTTNNVGLSFRTNNVIRQTIDNTGNVGIGTVTPTAKLQINNLTTGISIRQENLSTLAVGNTAKTQYTFGSTASVHGTDGMELTTATGAGVADFTWGAYNGISFGERMRLTGGGRLGIGKSTPASLLDVGGYNTSFYNIRTGDFVIQPVGLNNGLLADNSYYNGASWTRINTGFACGFQFFNGQILFNNTGTGTGNFTQTASMKTDPANSGSVALGGSINFTSGNYTGSKMVVLGTGNVGIGLTAPTSTVHVNGSQAGVVTNITATTTLNATHHKILVRNGAIAITITFPDALTCLGREYVISRAAGSTGTITLQSTGTNTIQALIGTTGATSSIGNHSGAGAGLRHSFTAINIGGVGVWVRL
jgi:hypothetical protein